MGWEDIRHEFLLECLKRGLLTNGNLLPSLTIGDTAVLRAPASPISAETGNRGDRSA